MIMEDPKSETRNPKEIQSPKSETNARQTQKCVSGFGFWTFLRISGFGLRISRLVLCSALCVLTSEMPAHATPTQEDVFKSISSNVDDKVDGQKVLGLAEKNQPVKNLVTLLLCPSLIKKARESPQKRR
jgi:hypothetical protein